MRFRGVWTALLLVLLYAGPAFGDLAEEYCREGAALEGEWRHKEAAARYEEALRFDPSCAEAHYSLGRLYLRQLGAPDQALEHFQAYLELDIASAAAKEYLAEAKQAVFMRRLEHDPLVLETPVRTVDPGNLPEPGRDEEVTRAPESSGIAPEPHPTLQVIQFQGLSGTIVRVEGGTATVDLGSEDGAVEGMQFEVHRAGHWVGMVRAKEVSEKTSQCSALAGRQTGEGASVSWGFRVGDRVRQREDVLGISEAREAEARKMLIGWQKEEQALERRLRDLQNRERSIALGMLGASTDAVVGKAEELEKLYEDYRKWQGDYRSWMERILEEQAKLLAGNPHIAEYHETLKEKWELEEKGSIYRRVKVDIQAQLLDLLAGDGRMIDEEAKEIGAGGRELEEQASKLNTSIEEYNMRNRRDTPEAKSAIRSLDESIKDHRRGKEILSRRIGKYNRMLGTFREKLIRIFEQGVAVEEDEERWQATDEVWEFTAEQDRRLAVGDLMNLGRYYLLTDHPEKAKPVYRSILEQDLLPAESRQAGDGLELALILLALERTEVQEAEGFAPPLEACWSRKEEGLLRGGLRSRNDVLHGFFEKEDGEGLKRTTATARRLADGEIVWSFDFEGHLAGDWIAHESRVTFAVDGGALYSLDAETGELLGKWELESKWRPLRWSALLDVDEGVYWWFRGEGSAERILFLDFADPQRSRSFDAPWPLREVVTAGTGVAVSARMERGPQVYDKMKETFDVPASVVVSLGGEGQSLGISLEGGGVPVWMEARAGYLMVSVVQEGHGVGERASLLCFFPLEEREESGWRVAFPGRDAVADTRLDGSTLFVLLRDGLVSAVDLETRRVLWTTDLLVPSVGFHYARFITEDETSLTVLGGPLEPPWRVYMVDKGEGVVSAEATVPSGGRSLPACRDGYLYYLERDGSLSALDLARDKVSWRYRFEEEPKVFLPAVTPREEAYGDGLLVAGFADWQGEINELAYGRGAGEARPLLVTGEALICYSSRQGRIVAFREADETR